MPDQMIERAREFEKTYWRAIRKTYVINESVVRIAAQFATAEVERRDKQIAADTLKQIIARMREIENNPLTPTQGQVTISLFADELEFGQPDGGGKGSEG